MIDPAFEDGGLVFEIAEELQAELWQQSNDQAGSTGRWNAYLNRLCLKILPPWIAAETGLPVRVSPAVWSLPSLWEFVNGTALCVGESRWVLLPDENLDTTELRVPEEWVRVPDWVADHYLGVQVNLSEGTLRVWGGTTHHQLLNLGRTEAADRCLYLTETDLITDPGLLWAHLVHLEAVALRAPVPPLVQPDNARNLVERLAAAAVVLPRLELPLHLWLPLISHDGRRQELFDRRSGRVGGWSPLSWLLEGVAGSAREAGWRAASPAGARGTGERDRVFQRNLIVAGQACQLRLLGGDANVWRFQLRPADADASLGTGTVLRLLDEDLRGFPSNEDCAAEPSSELFVEFGVEPGDGIVWEIEPIPEGYTQEILRF